MPKLAAYCTTKFAMVGFSDALRAEYGRDGLGVTALCPGFVSTNLFASAPLGEKSKEHKLPPQMLCTSPEKVARAAVRAIRRCRQFEIPAKFVPYYADWKILNVQFDPPLS